MTTATIDIETNTKHDKVWLAGVHYHDKDVYEDYTTPQELVYGLMKYGVKELWHWNGIGFDLPVLSKQWEIELDHLEQVDGMVLSRLHDPSRATGHSLASYGAELGDAKGDFTDYDGPGEIDEETVENSVCGGGQSYITEVTAWMNRMGVYCEQDVRLTTKTIKHLQAKLQAERFSEESIQLEHDVQRIICQQQRNGFKIDLSHTLKLQAKLETRMEEINEEMQQVFPPITTIRISEKTGRRLKDGVEVFNPASRKQIAERLMSVGVKFPNTTEKGNVIVDEETLEGIDMYEAKLILEYLTLQKRTSQIASWLKVVGEDGRVHGRVNSNGAVTGRMTHSHPNMAQIPATRKLYGKECRQCWTVDEGNKLVGIDASGLELRMLAHYMKDDEYIKEVVEGDVHTKNQQAAGLSTRDQAKTFIYALIYGAGSAKIGAIANKSAREGTKLKQRFLDQTPALKKLIELTQKIAEAHNSVPGLDGRRIRVREDYKALNTLLQGAGAIVMKKALVIFDGLLRDSGVFYKFVANVHDEWQLECKEEDAEFVGEQGVIALEMAGRMLNMRCPLTGEFNIGDSWAETH
jgi:DNA polymerase-1